MSTPYLAYGSPRPQVVPKPYMYPPNNPSSTYSLNDSSTTIPGKYEFAPEPSRTPSPTPSEAAELARATFIDWKALTNWRFWLRREWIWYYLIAIILVTISALVTIYHHQIVQQLTPATQWMKSVPGGWSIPIGILFIISFPPLFGHEIVAILCGVVWGLWIGFAIVAAGTFAGELGNFYAFKWCCRARGEKLERTNIQYGCLARVVREGGFRIALIARFSAIPGHFTTAVFSSCGMSVWIFALAAFLSLPKQFATVYIGVLIEGVGKSETVPQRVASYALIVVTTIVTLLAAWYIFRDLHRVKPVVIYERRKARQAKMELTRSYYNNNESTVSAFNPNPSGSDSDLPLQRYDPERDPGFEESTHQQWDAMGRAVGYAPDPRLHAPRPRPSFSPSALYTPPDAAVAVISSGEPEDEWSNAHTPKTARPPDVAPIAVTIPVSTTHSKLSPASEYTPTPINPAATLSFPSPHSPPSAAESQYITYQPEQFAVSPASGHAGAAPGAAQPHYSSSGPMTGLGSVPSRRFSPPPSYR